MWLGRCQVGRASVAFVLFALSTFSAHPSGYKKLGGSASDSCLWGAMYTFSLDYFEASVHTRHGQNFFLPFVPPASVEIVQIRIIFSGQLNMRQLHVIQ
jgi:hypothetical protein